MSSISLQKDGSTNCPSICTCVNVRRASRAITRIYDNALEPTGLKITQYSVLANIMHFGPINISNLANKLLLDRTTLVRNIKLLDSSKFIEYVKSTDTRERTIQLSETGRAIIEQAKPFWKIAQKQVETYIGKDQVQQLGHLAVALENQCEEGVDAA